MSGVVVSPTVLFLGYKETVMTEELLKKKALKSERRREVAAQKREKEKVSPLSFQHFVHHG